MLDQTTTTVEAPRPRTDPFVGAHLDGIHVRFRCRAKRLRRALEPLGADFVTESRGEDGTLLGRAGCAPAWRAQRMDEMIAVLSSIRARLDRVELAAEWKLPPHLEASRPVAVSDLLVFDHLSLRRLPGSKLFTPRGCACAYVAGRAAPLNLAAYTASSKLLIEPVRVLRVELRLRGGELADRGLIEPEGLRLFLTSDAIMDVLDAEVECAIEPSA